MVDTPMPLTAHLAELRSRLIWCVVALAVGFIVCYGFSDRIVAALQSPVVLVGQPIQVPLQIIAPAEAFVTYIKVGLIAGLVSRPAIYFVSTLEVCRAWPARTREEVYGAVSDWCGSAVLWRWGHFLLRPPLCHAFPPQLCQGRHQSPTLSRVLCDVLCALDDRLWPGVSVAHGGDLPHPTGAGILTPARQTFSLCRGAEFCRGGGFDPTTDPVSLVAMVLPMLLLYGLSILAAKGVELRQA